MRVGIDFQWAANEATGIGKYTWNWSSRLPSLAREDEFVFYSGRNRIRPEHLARISELRNVTVHKVWAHRTSRPIQLGMLWRDQLGLPSALSRHRCDIAFMPYMNASVGWLSRSIVVVTDLDIYLFRRSYTSYMRAYYNGLLALICRFAWRIIAISQFTKQELVAHLSVDPQKVCVVYPGVSAAFKPISRELAHSLLRERFGIADAFVLYTGGLTARKNVHGLLAAFRHARALGQVDIKLVTTGDLDAFVGREAAWRLKAEGVLCVGQVTEPELVALYNAAAVVVYPSFYEGFGLPVAEAQACGAAVIGTSSASIPEVMGDGGLLVAPGDVETLGSAIVQVACTPCLRSILRQRGLVNAQRFSWSRGASQLSDLLKHWPA